MVQVPCLNRMWGRHARDRFPCIMAPDSLPRESRTGRPLRESRRGAAGAAGGRDGRCQGGASAEAFLE